MSSTSSAGPRMLVVAIAGGTTPEEARRLAAEDLRPDAMLAEDAYGATMLEDSDLARRGGVRGAILRRLPIPQALALEAWWRRREFDVVLSWGEHVAFPLALLMALTPRRRIGHIAILMWPFNERSHSRARRAIKRVAYRLLARHGIDRLCIPSPHQRRLALERWGIAAAHVLPVQWPIDTRFWHPLEGEGDIIASAGVEMRDYPTLLSALEGSAIPIHIAGGTGVLKPTFMPDDAQVRGLEAQSLGAHVTVAPKSPVELRELYARARLVVVPVLPSESDNGVTVVAEAMAMARPVISSATAGRAEILRDGVNCVLVPPGDVAAMRAAIEELWDDPERCARLGAAARETIVPAHGFEQWVSGILAGAASLAEDGARSDRE
jgi:glycosyltransferase involved in cell wall biosynthesis